MISPTLFAAWSDFWRPDFFAQTAVFLSLVVRGLGLGLLIGLPLGIALTRMRVLAGPIIYLLGLVQTIPSLALLGFLISVAYLFGGAAAIAAAVVYVIFPIVLNTYTGITQVDPRVKDAARGMGMTGAQLLWQVELPLAVPVIMAGVKTAAVYTIGVITICAIAGTGGLGEYIVRGVTMGDAPLILLGVVPILIVTVAFFLGLGWLERFARRQGTKGLRLGLLLVAAACCYALAMPIIEALGRGTGEGEAIGEIVTFRARTWEDYRGFIPELSRQSAHFISMTVQGLGMALLLGIPIGIALTRMPRLASPLIGFFALLQTIPSLALLGFCISVPLLFEEFLRNSLGVEASLGLLTPFGTSAVIVATVVYALFPIVLNTFTGIDQVDPRVRDAARGMGMTDWQILWRVELPLGLPVLMDGVRTAAAYAVALVTVGGVLGGARGLGEFVISGIQRQDHDLVLAGIIPIAVISLCIFWLLSGIERLRRMDASLSQVVAMVLIVSMSAYAVAAPLFRRQADVKIGSKNFTENLLLGYLLQLLIEDRTDLTVAHYPNLGSNYAFKALRAGHLDMYPEYTGTALIYKDALHESPAIAVERAETLWPEARLWTRAEKITRYVRHEMERRFGLRFLAVFGLNNTYAVLVPKHLAEKYDLRTIGDLRKTPTFRVIVDQEFKDRPDGWQGLVRTYGLQFEQPPRQFDPNLLYRALRAGDAEVVVGFATDWQIPVLDLVVLEDDRGYFPSYHAAPLVRVDLLERYPQLEPLLNELAGRVDDRTARDLIRRVVVDRRWAYDVAREFLQEQGLIEQR